MGLLEPQAVLSWQGWVEGDGPSSSKKYLLDKLRCEQLSSDHQDEWDLELCVISIAVIWKAMFMSDRT